MLGTKTRELQRSYPAVPASVPVAREAVCAFAVCAGVNEEQLEAVRLAASEAVTNAVLHAYGDDPGRLHLRVRAEEDELWVHVGDDGGGLGSARPSRGLGMGLSVIAQESNGMSLSDRPGGGLELGMRFRLAPTRRRGVSCAGAPEMAPWRTERERFGSHRAFAPHG